jgi:hypothetical protein
MAIPSQQRCFDSYRHRACNLMQLWNKIATFLCLNVGIQLPPIAFLYWRMHGKPNVNVFEYVNCTLLVGISLGMLVATISDSFTDFCKVTLGYRVLLFGLTGIGLCVLGIVIELEFVQKLAPNEVLLGLSGGVAAFLVIMGAAVKTEIWRAHEGRG